MGSKNVQFCKFLHNAEAVDLGPQLWAPPPHWAPAALTFKLRRNEDRILKRQRKNKTPLITCLRDTNSILISAVNQGQQRSCSPEKTWKNRSAAHLYSLWMHSQLASKCLLLSESSSLLPSSFSIKYFPVTPCFEVPRSLTPRRYWTIYCYCELVCHLPVGFYRVHVAQGGLHSWTRLLSCTFQSASHLDHHSGVFFPLIFVIIWGCSSCPLISPFLHESSIYT